MNASMHLVTLKDTGHILTALAQTTSSADPDLAALVGTDLPVWAPRKEGSTELATYSLLPVEVLELKSVPFNAAVIANPQKHVVDGGRVEEIPDIAATTPDLATDTVTLKGGAADTGGVCVIALKGSAETYRRVQAGKVDPTTLQLMLPLSVVPDEAPASIPSGNDYNVFVALAGKRPTWFTQNVP